MNNSFRVPGDKIQSSDKYKTVKKQLKKKLQNIKLKTGKKQI